MTDRQTIDSLGERMLIARIRARLGTAPDWLLVGPGDDGAVVRPERNRCDVITTDVSVEGVHFDRRFVPASAIGHRALAVNLSDLAAMGAEPRYALLSLVVPPNLTIADFDAIVDGLLHEAHRHRVTLAGGNISRSPGPLMIDVTAVGTVHPRRMLRRSGARPGDFVFVSGTLGASRAGLEACRIAPEGAGTDPAFLTSRYLRPDARVRLGLLLGRQRAATSCIDVSDGLADGLHQIAEASGVGLEIEAERVPIEPAVRAWFEARGRDAVEAAVTDSDDYELMFTVSPRRQGPLRAVARLARGLPLTRIGTVTRAREVVLCRGSRRDALPRGYEHLGGE